MHLIFLAILHCLFRHERPGPSSKRPGFVAVDELMLLAFADVAPSWRASPQRRHWYF